MTSSLLTLKHLVSEFFKDFDDYSSKANFTISRKLKSKNKMKTHSITLGSIYGGVASILADVLFTYLIFRGVHNMLSGKNDNVYTKTVENPFTAPDN